MEVKQSIYEASFFPRRRQAFRTIDCNVESYYQTVQDILFEVVSVFYRLVQAKKMLRNVLGDNYETPVSKAFEHRHDYKVAHLKVEHTEADVELVKARFHPTIGGAWNYYWVDEETYSRDDRYWAASLQIEVPLFGGSLRIWDLKEKMENIPNKSRKFFPDKTVSV